MENTDMFHYLCFPGSNNLEGGNSTPTNHGPSNPTAAIQLGPQGEDLCLPHDKVVRIMQQVLPPHAEISNDALETMQKCVSKFVSVVTDEANKRRKCEKRKVVSVGDLLLAMEKFGLNNYVDLLVVYYDHYNQNVAEKSGHGGVPASVPQIAANDMMPPPPPQSLPYGHGFQATPNMYPGTFGSNVGESSSAGAIRNFDPLAYLNPRNNLED